MSREYTLFQFETALKLKSKYSKRIYEILSQFKGEYKKILEENKTLPPSSKKKECIINLSVQELKERFNLIDPETGKEEYEKFAFFAKNVLKPAYKEINNNTEISFVYETKTTGRKITDLKFKIIKIGGLEALSDLTVSPSESPKMLAASTEEDPQPSPLENRLHEECKIDLDLAKKAVKKFPAEKVEWVMKGILQKYQEGKIESLGGYSNTIFEKWLKGAEPTFERKYIPTKSVNQTHQNVAQARMSGSEIKDKLKFKFQLKDEETYGLVYQYGLESKGLERLEYAIIKVDKLIDEGKIDAGSILQKIEEELNVKVKDFNIELSSILVTLCERFRLDSTDVKSLFQAHSLKDLTDAIAKVDESIKNGDTVEAREHILEKLKEELNGKVNVEVQHFNQPLFERSNSVSTIKSILASSIPKLIIPAESVEEEKIRREKNAIWEELIRRFEINDEEADVLVEEYSVEALKYAISKVVEALKTQQIPQESPKMIEELYKHLNLV